MPFSLSILALLLCAPTVSTGHRKPKPALPKPITATFFLHAQLNYHHGTVKLQRIVSVRLRKPRVFRRFTGRWQFDVYVNKQRIEVVRFNFPFLAKIELNNAYEIQAHKLLTANLTSRTRIKIPMTAAVSRVTLRGPGLKKVIVVWPRPKPTTRPTRKRAKQRK